MSTFHPGDAGVSSRRRGARRALLGLGITLLFATGAWAAPTCGNGLLEGGETCEDCAADCTVRPCVPAERRIAVVTLEPQPGFDEVGAVTVLVAYRSDRLAMPAKGNTPEIRARLKAHRPGTQLFTNDIDYGMRVLVVGDGIAAGPLFELAFDACQGGADATTADVHCRVESCSSGGAPLDGCTCSVTLR